MDKYVKRTSSNMLNKLEGLSGNPNRTPRWYKSKNYEKMMGKSSKFLRKEMRDLKSGKTGKIKEEKATEFLDKMEGIFKGGVVRTIVFMLTLVFCIGEVIAENSFSVYASRFLVGLTLFILPIGSLTAPLSGMNYILNDLLNKDEHHGFMYILTKLSKEGIYGIRSGLETTTGFLAWPIAKLILYIPLMVLSFISYIIPVIIGIALTVLTVIFAIISSPLLLFGVGEAADAGLGAVDEGVEAVSEEASVGISTIMEKGWRIVSNYVPIQESIKYYITGYILYDHLYPFIMKIYVVFALIVIIHFILNIFVRSIYFLSKKIGIDNYSIPRVLIYIIVSLFYYILQIFFIIRLFTGLDPIWTLRDILHNYVSDTLFDSPSAESNINFFKEIDYIFSGDCKPGGECTSNKMRTLYTVISIFVGFIIMLLTNKISDTKDIDDTYYLSKVSSYIKKMRDKKRNSED